MDPETTGTDLKPLADLMLTRIPAPVYIEGHGLQALVTNLDASPYFGRIAICRVIQGTIRRGEEVAWCRSDGTTERMKISELYITEALERVEAAEAGPGEIIAVAGIEDVTIGETLAALDDPIALPVISVDEPSMSVTIGINTSPLAGREGTQLTSRLLKSRLDSEQIGNVSIRVLPSERPDAWTVQGRGELQLAVLVETLRREGFELTVGRPEVVTRQIDGKLHEPVDALAVDIPEEFVGVVTQLLAPRKGRSVQMVNHGTGRVRMDYLVPSRGLLGFHTEFKTVTRGNGLLHQVFEGYEPWYGELRARPNGSMVADRQGPTTGYALQNLQERGTLSVGPGIEVYEGMIIGENARADDMDVNPTREKKQTNVRAAASDNTERLTPPQEFSLEQALEMLMADECLEVTPTSLRPRKVVLQANLRARQKSKARG